MSDLDFMNAALAEARLAAEAGEVPIGAVVVREGEVIACCGMWTLRRMRRLWRCGLRLVPTFHDPNDRVALNILAEVFKGREVIGIHSADLVLGLGTLHCMTQQQPGGTFSDLNA